MKIQKKMRGVWSGGGVFRADVNVFVKIPKKKLGVGERGSG